MGYGTGRRKHPRFSVPLPGPIRARLERFTNAGIDGLMSKSQVGAMALQTGLTVLENIYLGDPLPKLLEPMRERIQGHSRPKKERLPPGATRLEDLPTNVRADVLRQIGSQPDDAPSFEDVPHSATQVAPPNFDELIAPHAAMPEQTIPLEADVSAAVDMINELGPGKTPNVIEGDGLYPPSSVGADGLNRLQERAAGLGPMLANSNAAMDDLRDRAAKLGVILDEEDGFGLDVGEEVPNPESVPVLIEPEESDPFYVAPATTDAMTCEHGVRLDSKIPCRECSPFA